MATPRSILVVRLSSLGDVLLATPAVRALKEGFPDASISWLVEGSVAGLLAHQSFIDRVIEFPRGEIERSMRGGRVVRALRAFSAFRQTLTDERYDLVLDLHGIAKSALLARMARAERRIGFDGTFAREAAWTVYDERIGGGDRRLHKVERGMLFASRLGVGNGGKADLQTSSEADRYIDGFIERKELTHPLLAINPFSSKGSEFKRWSLANYGELIERLGADINVTVMILWGPGEEEDARRLLAMAGPRALLACPTTVSQLLSLLKRTDLYVGGDTGVMHLAALSGVPVVAIFGPTDHLVNGPYGPGHTIVRKEIPCSPCRDKKCEKRECIRSVGVEDVYGAVMAAWQRQRRMDGRVE